MHRNRSLPIRHDSVSAVPNATIGLVGGGQLGRMSALAAARLGYRCHILTRETDSPAAQVSHAVTISDYSDPVSLRAFAGAVDVISFEFENVSAEGLDLLASIRPVRPAPSVLRISQDRVDEKTFLNRAGVATAPWAPAGSRQELHEAVQRIGLPAVLKTTRLGYDGKGQAMLRAPEELDAAWERLTPKPADSRGIRRFRAGNQRGRRPRRGRFAGVLRHGGKSAPQPHPRPDAGAGADFRRGRSRRAVDRAACGGGAGPGRAAGGGDVSRQCRQRPGQRDRAAAAQFRPLDDRCVPGQPVRVAYPRHCRAAVAAGGAAFRRCA